MPVLGELLWKQFAPRVPQVELRRFKKIEFFPPSPPRFEDLEAICIASKTRTIGDPLQLSSLPSRLKARYPHLKIYTYPRGFNPAVFTGNPAVSGVQWLPDAVYGDDCNSGTGHLIQRKEQFFGLKPQDHPKPEIYLTASEKAWIETLAPHSPDLKPVCVIHPWGKTRASVLSQAFWEDLVRAHSTSYRFWQVGMEGQTRIAGCERHFLLPKGFHHARKLFAVLSRARAFVGVDSGPMHVARAFDVPSLILTDFGVPAQAIFEERDRTPGGARSPSNLGANIAWHRFFIYPDNRHYDVVGKSAQDVSKAAAEFIYEEADE